VIVRGVQAELSRLWQIYPVNSALPQAPGILKGDLGATMSYLQINVAVWPYRGIVIRPLVGVKVWLAGSYSSAVANTW